MNISAPAAYSGSRYGRRIRHWSVGIYDTDDAPASASSFAAFSKQGKRVDFPDGLFIVELNGDYRRYRH